MRMATGNNFVYFIADRKPVVYDKLRKQARFTETSRDFRMQERCTW